MASAAGHVLIIGGGVAGSALALLLHEAGISCAVYEARPHGEQVGGGLSVAPNGMNLLESLGLADVLTARGTRARESIFRNEKGRLIARVEFGDPARYGQAAVNMSRATLHDALVQAMRNRSVAHHDRKRLVSVSQSGDKVIARFEDGASAVGDLLVGADGVHSMVRRQVMRGAPKPAYIGIIGIGGFVPLQDVASFPESDREALTFTFGARGFFGHGGGDAGTIMWWTNLPRMREYSREELAEIDWPAIQQELLGRYGGYYEPIPSLIAKTRTLLRLNIYDIPLLPSWRQGRIILIGDAAHAVSPNTGQGASLALEDALYLAKLLRDMPGGHAAAFERFEHDRKPRVEKIVAEGRRRAAAKEVVSPLRAKTRELMMRILIPLQGEKSQEWILGYKIPWHDR